jgi:hypothetical protein
VRWCPRATGRLHEHYTAHEIAVLEGAKTWSIWADHPKAGWVWVVHYDRGRAVSVAASLLDLEVILS